ncbi:MAG: hypothetical protein FJY88_10340 [Candidatus Eisenbacteria bacterium]|nr:hypothetical protein [Candidatus Eisenbacteria bacterium]
MVDGEPAGRTPPRSGPPIRLAFGAGGWVLVLSVLFISAIVFWRPHLHSVLPDGLWVADSSVGGGAVGPLRFEPLPAPTTAEVEELAATVARRLMGRVVAAWEARGSDYLDPELAALCEALFFSRDPPVGKREDPELPGLEGEGIRGKPLCASMEGFSLHAAQAVPSWDREALERLLRYGLRAPFCQERLSLREDGRVVYRLRRPWPKEGGATHLILDPLDFLRRLAVLVSFPYSHQVRYHGVFANRSRMRRCLPSAPSREDAGAEAQAPCELELHASGRVGGEGRGQRAAFSGRRRMPWAQLLRQLLHVDALSCPRCSTAARSIPMVVLAFLTDPDVVGRILRHLGWPWVAPSLAPARFSGSEGGAYPVDVRWR